MRRGRRSHTLAGFYVSPADDSSDDFNCFSCTYVIKMSRFSFYQMTAPHLVPFFFKKKHIPDTRKNTNGAIDRDLEHENLKQVPQEPVRGHDFLFFILLP